MHIGRRLVTQAAGAQHVQRSHTVHRLDYLPQPLYGLLVKRYIHQFLHGIPAKVPADLCHHQSNYQRCHYIQPRITQKRTADAHNHYN